jgi:hypothetical protein
LYARTRHARSARAARVSAETFFCPLLGRRMVRGHRRELPLIVEQSIRLTME